MKLLANISLVVLIIPFISFSQEKEFSLKDFSTGKISINGTINSALLVLGRPVKVDTLLDQSEGDFITYHFRQVTIWIARRTNRISSIDISTPKLPTHRGIKIGDSVNKLEKLYGSCRSESELNRLHDNYDVGFKDFTEIKIYEYRPRIGAYYACFYIKNSKIVKIYLFKGLSC